MIRTEILRAKSLRSEISYLSDLKKAHQSAEIEAKKRADLDVSKRSLWSELSRVPSAPETSGKQADSLKFAPEYGRPASAKLQRLHQAQEAMLVARKSHNEANETLNSQLAKTSISRERVSLLQKMIAKGEIDAKARVESKMSDELSELVVTNRVLRGCRVGGESMHSSNSGSQLNTNGSSMHRSETVTGCPSSNISNTARIETVGFSNVGDLPTLSIKCSLGAQAPISLSVAKDKTGDLKVVIEQSAIRSALGIKTESEIIKARLGALGLKIASVEIAQLDSEGPKKGRARRHLEDNGDQDEIVVS